MVIRAMQRAHATRQYVEELRAAYAGHILYPPDTALAEDPFVMEKMLLDPHIATIVGAYKRAVAGREWTLEPGDDSEQASKKAGIVDDAFRKIKRFADMRQRLAHGRFTGRAYEYVCGKRTGVNLGGFGVRRWWMPEKFEHIDYRGIEIVPERDSKGVIDTYAQIRDLASANFRRLDQADMASLIALTFADEEQRLGHGRGLQEPMYFYFYLKGKTLQEGMQWLNRWAQGIIIGAVDATAEGNADQPSDTVASTMKTKLEKHRSSGVFVHDVRDEVKALFPAGTGWEAIWKAIDYFESKHSELVGIPKRPSGQDSGPTGARAQAETELDYAEGQWEADRDVLEECLTEHLVIPFCRSNAGIFAEIGLADAPAPRFSLAAAQRENAQENVQVISTALQADIELDAEEVYRKLNMTKPRKDAETIKGTPQVPPGNGGFPPGGPAQFADKPFDESKVKRDKGRFAKKEGAGADPSDGGGREPSADITDFKSGRDAIKALGIETVSVEKGMDHEPLQVAHDALASLKAEGIPLPQKVFFHSRGTGAGGMYDSLKQSVTLDTNWIHPNNVVHAEEFKPKEGDDTGWFSTPNVESTVIHEVGHFAHHEHLKSLGLDWEGTKSDVQMSGADQALAKKHVSQYAAANYFEFVSEVFTGLMLGKKYPEEVDRVYSDWQGPPIKGFGKNPTPKQKIETPDWLKEALG